MRIYRLEAPAATGRDIERLRSNVLFLFTFDEIENELLTIRKAMALPAKPTGVTMDDEDWEPVIIDLLVRLGDRLETDTLAEWARNLPDDSRMMVAEQIRRALAAARRARRIVDSVGSGSGLLLPALFQRRMQAILGFAELPIAWVRKLDVLRF
jgi:hypothetical protein